MTGTMRTAVLTAPETVEIWEVPVPTLSPSGSQVLVRVRACALCTWEQRIYRGSDPSAYPFRGGHEVAGVVVAKGESARCDAKEGDPVAVAAIVRCGACHFCRRGLDNLCLNDLNQKRDGGVWGPGGLSDYLLVEDHNVYRALPASLEHFGALADAQSPVEELTLSEPVACVLRSIAKGFLSPGDTALVQGAGVMGLLHLLLLQKQSVRVLVAEPDAARAGMAHTQGAAAVCDPIRTDLPAFVHDHTGGRGVEAAFFTAGGPSAVEQALGTLAKGGCLVLYGSIHPRDPVTVDPNRVHYDELTITGTFAHTKRSFQQAVTLISTRQLDVRPFISERIAFQDLDYAFRRAISRDTYRVVVAFDD